MASIITREQALCLLFCKEYNEDNIKMALEKVSLYEDLEICHAGDPLQPMLLPHVRIHSNPFGFKKYSSEADTVSQEVQDKTNVNFI
ncbi:uncharacterized protein B0P05DRAFT_525884 [Gilbertella persicaria]|uniref:uncharacterized protein n=1 Tax=Gilbertella persicaria TaxID=101096 RepID=UPI0022205722|nr:uncharacterized protein B0P05DRAFT_525884 [Gilbertella persicaria]KAI8092347.1 hypothetical protein B0P05DRAFT_525884 [Gilbertella persicaria]